MLKQNSDLLLENYNFDLPKELIASRPINGRHNSKLLVYNEETSEVIHDYFYNIDKYIPKESTLLLNQSKVFPCRLLGKKETGSKVECFVLETQSDTNLIKCLLKSNGKKRIGDHIIFEGTLKAEIISANDDLTFDVKFNSTDFLSDINNYAKIPIPPYIRNGESDEQDKTDYQTVYAKNLGSVAAPTAGLHFTEEIFSKLDKINVKRAFSTLHVGLGTFLPVKSELITEHNMHSEKYFFDKDDCELLKQSKSIFAVGTTSLRSLESSWIDGKFSAEADTIYDTKIFLHPGIDVKSISGLITNFHLPKSSLLMLVSSLVGREKTLELYNIAIKNKYRFFSYGDAMLILRKNL